MATKPDPKDEAKLLAKLAKKTNKMKLYQLIKDLQGEGATKALTHLITLDTLITQLENYVSESDDEARAWDITVRYKDALKEPVTFSMFDEEKESPISFKGFRKNNDHVSTNKEGFRIYRIQNQETGILMYNGNLGTAAINTIEELARTTKASPFELEI